MIDKLRQWLEHNSLGLEVFFSPIEVNREIREYVAFRLIESDLDVLPYDERIDSDNNRIERLYSGQLRIQIDVYGIGYFKVEAVANRIKTSFQDSWSRVILSPDYLLSTSAIKDLSSTENDEILAQKSMEAVISIDYIDERELLLINEVTAKGDFSGVQSKIEVKV